jgi:hypothetical protein
MVSLDREAFFRVLTRFLDAAEQMNAALANGGNMPLDRSPSPFAVERTTGPGRLHLTV